MQDEPANLIKLATRRPKKPAKARRDPLIDAQLRAQFAATIDAIAELVGFHAERARCAPYDAALPEAFKRELDQIHARLAVLGHDAEHHPDDPTTEGAA